MLTFGAWESIHLYLSFISLSAFSFLAMVENVLETQMLYAVAWKRKQFWPKLMGGEEQPDFMLQDQLLLTVH